MHAIHCTQCMGSMQTACMTTEQTHDSSARDRIGLTHPAAHADRLNAAFATLRTNQWGSAYRRGLSPCDVSFARRKRGVVVLPVALASVPSVCVSLLAKSLS